MHLRDYLNDAPRGTAGQIAKTIEVSPVMVTQWANGVKEVPAERCAAIEAATGREVMRWDLRPDDWHLIWPELKKAKGAPPVPEQKAVA